MVKQSVDRATRKTLLEARRRIEDISKKDSNEAETRSRIERILEMCMGYDVFKYVTHEYAIHGVGDTEHCDLAIKIDENESSKPVVLVEIKRVNVDLATKHLKQVASYAINIGCEWVLLTNGKEWRLYHISYGQPPQPTLVESWNLMSDEASILAEKFGLICFKSLKKGVLEQLWQRKNVLTASNILRAILSEESITRIRRSLKRKTGVAISPEDIIGAVRRLLNETAVAEMENIRISLPEKRQRRARATKADSEDKSQIPQSTQNSS